MFPEAFPGPLGISLIGTAWREADLWRLETVDIRAFSTDKRGFLDDTPAGVSSRKPRLSVEKARMSTVSSRQRSASRHAVPISEIPSGPGKASGNMVRTRSEERRVGKEGRSRWSPYH